LLDVPDAIRHPRLFSALGAACLAMWLGLGSAPASALPSLSALAKRHQDAVVRIEAPKTHAHLSTAFVIATVGWAVAVLPEAAAGDVVDTVFSSGERRPAQVLRKERDGPLALVALKRRAEDEVFAAMSVAERGRKTAGGWLVALCHDESARLSPAAGGLREIRGDDSWHLDLPCGAGAPIIGGAGRVVGVVTKKKGRTMSVGVDVSRVLALVAEAAPPAPPPG
jgi:hypothetical protein